MILRLNTRTTTAAATNNPTSNSILSASSAFWLSRPPNFRLSLCSSSSSSSSLVSLLPAAQSLISLLIGLLLGLLLLPSWLLPENPPSQNKHGGPNSLVLRDVVRAKALPSSSDTSLVNETAGDDMLPVGEGNSTDVQKLQTLRHFFTVRSSHLLQECLAQHGHVAEAAGNMQWHKSVVYASFITEGILRKEMEEKPSKQAGVSPSDWAFGRGWGRAELLPGMRVEGDGKQRSVQQCLRLREEISGAIQQEQRDWQLRAQQRAPVNEAPWPSSSSNYPASSPYSPSSSYSLDIKQLLSSFHANCHPELGIVDWYESSLGTLTAIWGSTGSSEENSEMGGGDQGPLPIAEEGGARGDGWNVGVEGQKARVSAEAKEPDKIAAMQGTKDAVGEKDEGFLLKGEDDQGGSDESMLPAPHFLWRRDWELFPRPHRNLSFILQYFRQPAGIEPLVDVHYLYSYGANRSPDSPSYFTNEFIANVDEPSAWKAWLERWQGTRDSDYLVVMFSHNLHEIRGYNNPSRVARSDFGVFLQDDDVDAADSEFGNYVLDVFQAHEKVSLVGYNHGNIVDGPWFSHPAILYRLPFTYQFRIVDPATKERLYFATQVDFAPLFAKRRFVLELGGVDEAFGKRGESGIFSDWQLAHRSWLAGGQNIHLSMKYERVGIGIGGTHILLGPGFSYRGQGNGVNGPALGYQHCNEFLMPRLARWVFHDNIPLDPLDEWS